MAGTGNNLKSSIKQANNQVTLSGIIRWTDSQGQAHAVRESTVKIWDQESVGADQLVTTVTTDQFGNYTATFDNDDGFFSGGRDIYLEVVADGPHHFVEGTVDRDNTAYSVKSMVIDDIPDGPRTLAFTLGNKTEAERAFSVSDALYVGSMFAKTLRGTPPVVEANYTTDGSFFLPSSQSINIDADDAWDWDVILHEYGHFLAEEDKLSNSPGGSHAAGKSNLASQGKVRAIRLAWDEGLSTYLSIAAQQVAQEAGILPGILNTGDTRYTDLIESNISYDLEDEGIRFSRGEADELSVSRILFDLADSNQDLFRHGLRDTISYGHQGLYDLLKTIPNLETLDDLWNHFERGSLTDRQLAEIGAIFEEAHVSPSPQNTLYVNFPSGDESPPPTFFWWASNNYANDEFQVIIFDQAFNRIAISPKVKDATQWTMTEEQWAQLKENPGQYNFVITGSDTDDGPTTGNYWSGAYEFTVLKKSLSEPIPEDIPADWPPLDNWPSGGWTIPPEGEWTPKSGIDWTPKEWTDTPNLPQDSKSVDNLVGRLEQSSLVGANKETDPLTDSFSEIQSPGLEIPLTLDEDLSLTGSNLIASDGIENNPLSLGVDEPRSTYLEDNSGLSVHNLPLIPGVVPSEFSVAVNPSGLG
ncbi:hypothetical protein [Leptothoe spongobia]|uniref:Uncharacterized protein n=1 Tax=Leptothoe spongobia TAU-MAC 1115 TaxID=1967444 RepID=A0A947DDJ5_9CYAN|nr:hypothetical protein [Leptothoe spongobia]MBT9314569.1 hypothetical protein [Leptothoe spongobia TAU-MAC 1115]